jgi:lipopolysaccharide export system permease protein
MSIFSRYVSRQTAGALVLIVVSLTAVVWIAVALRQLELITNQGQNALRFLTITTLAVPSMMAVIAPIGLLIASIHVLNKLNGDSELIVMTAGGMAVWKLLRPFLWVAIAVALAVAFVNHIVGPWSQRALRSYSMLVRADLMTQVLQPWLFTSPEAKLTVHIRDRMPSGELLGLLMHDARDPKQQVTYLAERARIIKQGDDAYLRMQKGHIVRRLPDQAAPQIVVFDDYMVDLNQLERRADQPEYLRPRELDTPELISPNRNDPLYQRNPGRFVSELHERLSSPLYPFAFVLITLAFLGHAKTTRQNRLNAVVSAFTVATVCRILGISAANATAIRPSAAWALYAIPIGAAVAAAIAVQWQAYPRPPTRLARALGAVRDAWAGRLVRLWHAVFGPRAVRRSGGRA